MYKKCKKCQTWKPLDGFYKCKKAADNHQTNCKECKALIAKSTNNKPADTQVKTCSICYTIQNIKEYRAAKNTEDGYRPECKSCKYVIDKEYRKNNPQVKIEGNRRYDKNITIKY